MCGGGSADDGGAAQREQERQARIQQGYDQIKKIFEGYSTGANAVTNPTAGGSYYNAEGAPVTVRSVQVPGGAPVRNRDGTYTLNGQRYLPDAGNLYSEHGQFMGPIEAFRGAPTSENHVFQGNTDLGSNAPIFSSVQKNPGFDDAFYADRAKSYTDFAMPQLEQQYGDAEKQLIYALARTGRLASSTRGDKFGRLQQNYDIQKTKVADKANEYAGNVRSNVEKSRSDLTALNASLADPNAIASQAALAAQSLKTQQAFDPLAPLFQNVTEGLATQADLERRNAARYSTGMFTPSISGGGAGRNVRVP